MKKLHIGCGGNYIKGWINADIDGDKKDVLIDITKRMPYLDGEIDLILNQHLIEHVTRQDGMFFCREAYRVLKPGGIIRVSTPDLDMIINDYLVSKKEGKLTCYWQSPNSFFSACDCLNQAAGYGAWNAWGHKYTYNEEDLAKILQLAGFKNIIRKTNTTSTDPQFLGIENNRPECLTMEAIK